MASSPLPPAATLTGPSSTRLSSATATATTTSLSPFFPNKSQKPTKQNQCIAGGVRCKATNNGDNSNAHLEQGLAGGRLDRRNMLIGLGAGGLYGAASLENNPVAFAAPVSAPDLTKCGDSEYGDPVNYIDCCPPVTTKIIDFKFPSQPGPLRNRRAAQDVAKDPAYLAKYKKAIALMRALPESDPRSFAQQAMVHCTYCDGGYPQVGFSDLDIQVHNCWLFFPFHRWYLYFFEKIMGELIGDPTFALPFWNWDAPAGMYIPDIFEDESSSLYDENRNQNHRHKKVLLDLNYSGTDDAVDDATRIKENLTTMYQQMVAKANSHRLFYGEPYSAGDSADPGPGNIENIPHGNIHFWTGDTNRQPYGEDMGNFYSAGRDPLFYSHHSNVDRMWSLYKELGGTDIDKTDWLDTEFLFYDEKKNLVKVKVRDSLDTRKLGYTYDSVPIPWLNSKPTPRKPSNKRTAAVSSGDLTTTFPATLTDKISVEVKRPSVTVRTTAEKKAQDEVLVIKDIQFAGNETVKFDVYVNDDADTEAGRDQSEFAGSFMHIPHKKDKSIKTTLRLSITKLLEELDAETDDSLVVTLVPKVGKGPITIGGFGIELINTT